MKTNHCSRTGGNENPRKSHDHSKMQSSDLISTLSSVETENLATSFINRCEDSHLCDLAAPVRQVKVADSIEFDRVSSIPDFRSLQDCQM